MKETSRRCLDNGLVTGMFTRLICIRGKRKPKHEIGVTDTDTTEHKKTKDSKQTDQFYGWVSRKTLLAGKTNNTRPNNHQRAGGITRSSVRLDLYTTRKTKKEAANMAERINDGIIRAMGIPR